MVQQSGRLCEKFRMLACDIKDKRGLCLMDGGKTAFWIVEKLSVAVLTGKNSHWATADDMAFHLPASRVFCDGGHRLRRLEELFQQSHFVFYKLLKTNGKRRGVVLRKKLCETLFIMFRDCVLDGGLLIFLLKF